MRNESRMCFGDKAVYIGLCLGLVFGAPAYAQIEEIIVVAQKREENLQSVPISISAFGAAELYARTIESITDMSGPTPGLIVSGNLRSAQIFIRGIGSEDISIGTEGSIEVAPFLWTAKPDSISGSKPVV